MLQIICFRRKKGKKLSYRLKFSFVYSYVLNVNASHRHHNTTPTVESARFSNPFGLWGGWGTADLELWRGGMEVKRAEASDLGRRVGQKVVNGVARIALLAETLRKGRWGILLCGSLLCRISLKQEIQGRYIKWNGDFTIVIYIALNETIKMLYYIKST